jgi:hypothetical protein
MTDLVQLVAFIQIVPESAKQHDSPSSNNRTMDAIADPASIPRREVVDLTAALASWYASHASIRRLWAIEGHLALEIRVALEPTSDGNDALPVWLANRRAWANDLRLLAQREVQLRLVIADDFGEFYISPDAVTIAELHWRECW